VPVFAGCVGYEFGCLLKMRSNASCVFRIARCHCSLACLLVAGRLEVDVACDFGYLLQVREKANR
jgi:hypothetical protein